MKEHSAKAALESVLELPPTRARASLRHTCTAFIHSLLSLHSITTRLSQTQLFVFMLLLYQPFYVGGIEDLQKAKNSAFGAMLTFCATFVVSLVLWWRDVRIKRRLVILARQHSHDDLQEYAQVPRMDAIENYQVNLSELPVSVVESGSTLKKRLSRSSFRDDQELREEEMESAIPHVPEGQLLPTTHV